VSKKNMVNWALAIDRNRDALLRIVEALFAMAGLSEVSAVATLPRHLRNAVLRILRPAESAVRRLVIIAARELVADVHPVRSVILGPDPETSEAPSLLARTHSVKCKTAAKVTNLSLPLLDPLKRFNFAPPRRRGKSFPRITFIGLTEPAPIPDDWFPSPDDPVDATRLCRRLHTLRRVLDDLDGYAKRLARWRAKRDLGLNRTGRFHPMRPGWPPGHRKRPFHEVDEVLRECHSLAHYAQREDTS
jgi:hypothetical protein